MKSIFKSKLVSYNLFPQDPGLPSPDALKKKILVKNKKIQESKYSIKFQVFLPNKCLSF